jgi:hypothetical protein
MPYELNITLHPGTVAVWPPRCVLPRIGIYLRQCVVGRGTYRSDGPDSPKSCVVLHGRPLVIVNCLTALLWSRTTDKGLKLELPPVLLSKDRWAEMRRTKRVPTGKTGRLGYGGPNPGVIHCRVLDLSESGVRVETNVTLSPMPEFFSIEFCDVYCRVRRCWAKGYEIGLEFIFDAVKGMG